MIGEIIGVAVDIPVTGTVADPAIPRVVVPHSGRVCGVNATLKILPRRAEN